MTRGVIRSILVDDRGAVGPMYALALFALVAIAGVGFDYGRMAAAQSELQNAADQAALAAATQLTGSDGARARAIDAARNYFQNRTRIADDGDGPPITIPDSGFTFYSDGNASALATSDTDATAVEVSVNPRDVFYALTPVVAAYSSGGLQAHARAALRRAMCQLPPIMVCIDRNDFNLPANKGKGLRMRWRSSDDVEPLAPGNWGFLDVRGVHASNVELGENSANYCSDIDNVITEPGFRTKETPALNTRFDIPFNVQNDRRDCDSTGTGDFCPAEGVGKNYVLMEEHSIETGSATPLALGDPVIPACSAAPATRNNKWISFADKTLAMPAGNQLQFSSLRMDTCFYNGTCTYLGDGVWDIDRYLATWHPGVSKASLPSTTRFGVYQWELADKASRLRPRAVHVVDSDPKQIGKTGRYTHKVQQYCTYSQPVFSSPLAPSSTQRDRRILTIMAAKCRGLTGRSPVTPLGWMDTFLIEPASDDDPSTLKVEIIGPALTPDNLNGFQYYGHNKAVLIR